MDLRLKLALLRRGAWQRHGAWLNGGAGLGPWLSPWLGRWLGACLSALAVLACSESALSDPPKRAQPAPKVAAPATPPPAPNTGPGVEHTVGEGETLWDIASAYEVSVEDLLRANQLDERDVRRLSTGRVLRIPGATAARTVAKGPNPLASLETLPPLADGAYHVVGEGETIWNIARSYNKGVEEITTRNNLSDDDLKKLRPGSALIIPGIRAVDVKKTPAPAQRRGITHVMEPGETIWDLASEFQVSVAELLSANGIDKDRVATLRDGTKLFIPGVTSDKRGKVTRTKSVSQSKATAVAKKLGLGTRTAAGELLRGHVRAPWLRAAGGGTRLPGTLKWPVSNGTYVRGYGSGEGGYHLATDIRGDIGWNVRAAAPGIVGYSGNELRGFGNLVILIHPGGWVTLYAHNSANFVVAGQRVDRSSILAEVGSTGLSRGPHVHFEFIHGGKNCDPSSLFRPGMRYRSGRVAAKVKPQEWTRPKDRPRNMRCAPRRGHPKSFWVLDEDPEKDAEPAPPEPASDPAAGASGE
jgi:murein DD-endopeptidase MepM/ murein hydrolase activator NlpD